MLPSIVEDRRKGQSKHNRLLVFAAILFCCVTLTVFSNLIAAEFSYHSTTEDMQQLRSFWEDTQQQVHRLELALADEATLVRSLSERVDELRKNAAAGTARGVRRPAQQQVPPPSEEIGERHGTDVPLTKPGIVATASDQLTGPGEKSDPLKGPAVVPQSQDCKRPEWILWAGDSNMRHTFHTWIKPHMHSAKTVHTSPTFGVDMATGGQAVRWADQEAVLDFPNGEVMRASFRFLHGSTSEFLYDTQHWHEARVYAPFEDQDPARFNPSNGLVVDLAAVKPSAYALEMTKQGAVADYSKTHPALYHSLQRFKDASPSVVVLTEGWGGVPYCSYFPEMEREVFQVNPTVKFVWAPIYVTNHDTARYECFKEATSDFQSSIRNLKFVNLWDISQHLGGAKHTPVGGTHMMESIQRLQSAWCEALQGSG